MERILSRGWAEVGGLQASLKKQQKVGLKRPRGRRSLNIQAQPQSYEAGREAGLEAGEAGVEASLKARSLSLSARLKSLEAGLGDKPRAWLAGRTKAYK